MARDLRCQAMKYPLRKNFPASIGCAAFLLLSLLPPADAQNNPDEGLSLFLREPETILPFLEESADFWLAAWDAEEAAFFSEVGRDGTPFSQNKAFLAQSRNAYAMAKAFMITGEEDYLTYADGALRFLYDVGWDEDNGGWWGQAAPNGTISTGIWYNNSRWSFWQHYMLLGPSAYIEATRDPFHEEWLEKGNAVNDEELWDDRPGREGYFNNASLDWSTKTGKGFTPTVDAITTNALTNYLLTRDPARRDRLTALGDNIADKMVRADHGHLVSFPSDYDADWNVDFSEETTSIGHHLKTGWSLARVFLIDPDPRYRETAKELMDEIWNFEGTNGVDPWDHENGIMRQRLNVYTGAVSGNADWWTVEQAVTGGLMNWYLTRDPAHLQMANDAIAFFMANFYDEEFGEVFSVVSNTGRLTDSTKGDMFKAGYHSIELFYLLYLYGNLYYHNQPVTLHYRFEAAEEDRSLHLWPLAIEDERLVIEAVQKDGAAYGNFSRRDRTLEVPAGESGVYAVTFASRYATNPPAHFHGDWWEDWFGWYYHDRTTYPWVYLPEAGWCYLFPNGKSRSGWLYDVGQSRYLFTSAAAWPFVYSPGEGWGGL